MSQKGPNSGHWHLQIGDTHFVAYNENTRAGAFLHATACRVAAAAP
jgi:hypothetical protein